MKTNQPIYVIERGRIAYTFNAALANMRKPEDWVIYPVKDDTVTIQCNTRIARFSLLTGEGVISARRSGGAYGVHLSPSLGATQFIAPAALVEAINESPVSGNTATLGGTQARYSHA